MTPLVHIAFEGWKVGLKLEGVLQSSHKERAAAAVVESLRRCRIAGSRAQRTKKLVMSSSGNAAFAVAKAIAGMDINLVVFTDVLSPPEMADRLCRMPDVDVIIIDQPDSTGSHAKARKASVRAYLAEHPDAIELDQYQDSQWPCGYFSLARELEQQTSGQLGTILVPVGTCATLRSLVQYKLRYRRNWKLVAVDAIGSALFGEPSGRRRFSGYGNGAKTEWAREAEPYLYNVVRVRDASVVSASRHLLTKFRLELGASSCATFAAVCSLIRSDCLHMTASPFVLCLTQDIFTDRLFTIRNSLKRTVSASRSQNSHLNFRKPMKAISNDQFEHNDNREFRGWFDLYESSAESLGHWSGVVPPFFHQLNTHLPSRGSILELCCGDGRITEELVRLGAKVSALDLCPAALKQLQINFKHNALDVPMTIIGSAMDIPLGDEQFDAVVCINGFAHLHRPVRALREVARVLRPGGKFIVDVFTPEDQTFGKGEQIGAQAFLYKGCLFQFFNSEQFANIYRGTFVLAEKFAATWSDPPHNEFRPEAHQHHALVHVLQKPS
jgi:N-(2-amino-2-carboxyethyl)-L-glutamate synthase